MIFIYQRRKPVKRCRRGKNIICSPTINFNCKSAYNPAIFTQMRNIEINKIIKILSFLCLVFIFLLYVAITNDSLNDDSLLYIGAVVSHNSKQFTTAASQKLKEFIDPENKKEKLNVRDVERFIQKYKSLEQYKIQYSNQKKSLHVACYRLKKRVTQLLRISKDDMLPAIENISDQSDTQTPVESLKADKYSLEAKEVDIDCKAFSNGLTNTDNEAGKLVKVHLESKASFRSFSRIIKGLNIEGLYSGRFTPSPNTLINWMIRAGVGKLNKVKNSKEQSIDVIDHWIGAGNYKLFVVLRIYKSKLKHRLNSGTPPKLSDFNVVHIEIVHKSNGEKVRSSLEKLYKNIGHPTAITSDSGSDLKKGIELLNENIKDEEKVFRIQDISHKVACILKGQYGNEKWFLDFFSNLGEGNKLLYNSKDAYLKAPRQNSKGRFMNIDKQVKWFISTLANIKTSNASHSEKDDMLKAYFKAYSGLESYREEIIKINEVIEMSHEIMALLKAKGLSEVSYKRCLEIIIKKRSNPLVKQKMIDWLKTHKEICHAMAGKGWDIPLLITSDPIESFFSKYKSFQKRTPQSDPTRTVALLPLLVGDNSSAEIQNLILSVSHQEALDWVEKNVPQTIYSKKRALTPDVKIKKRTKTGNIDQILGKPNI